MTFPTSLSVLLIPLARAVLALELLGAGAAHAERLKDLASIQGVRGNQLIGYGLVVGWTAAATRCGRRCSRSKA